MTRVTIHLRNGPGADQCVVVDVHEAIGAVAKRLQAPLEGTWWYELVRADGRRLLFSPTPTAWIDLEALPSAESPQDPAASA